MPGPDPGLHGAPLARPRTLSPRSEQDVWPAKWPGNATGEVIVKARPVAILGPPQFGILEQADERAAFVGKVRDDQKHGHADAVRATVISSEASK